MWPVNKACFPPERPAPVPVPFRVLYPMYHRISLPLWSLTLRPQVRQTECPNMPCVIRFISCQWRPRNLCPLHLSVRFGVTGGFWVARAQQRNLPLDCQPRLQHWLVTVVLGGRVLRSKVASHDHCLCFFAKLVSAVRLLVRTLSHLRMTTPLLCCTSGVAQAFLLTFQAFKATFSYARCHIMEWAGWKWHVLYTLMCTPRPRVDSLVWPSVCHCRTWTVILRSCPYWLVACIRLLGSSHSAPLKVMKSPVLEYTWLPTWSNKTTVLSHC